MSPAGRPVRLPRGPGPAPEGPARRSGEQPKSADTPDDPTIAPDFSWDLSLAGLVDLLDKLAQLASDPPPPPRGVQWHDGGAVEIIPLTALNSQIREINRIAIYTRIVRCPGVDRLWRMHFREGGLQGLDAPFVRRVIEDLARRLGVPPEKAGRLTVAEAVAHLVAPGTPDDPARRLAGRIGRCRPRRTGPAARGGAGRRRTGRDASGGSPGRRIGRLGEQRPLDLVTLIPSRRHRSQEQMQSNTTRQRGPRCQARLWKGDPAKHSSMTGK